MIQAESMLRGTTFVEFRRFARQSLDHHSDTTHQEYSEMWKMVDFYFLCNIQNAQWPAIYTD